MCIMLNLPFQFQKPLMVTTCLLHKPFVNDAPFQIIADLTRTHGNNFSIGFIVMSQPKHCVLSIGSLGFRESPKLHKGMAPSAEFGLSEEAAEEEYVDDNDGEEEYGDDDEYVEGKENFDASFVSKNELAPWGDIENDYDDEEEECVEGRENFDTSFVGKKGLPPWGDDDGDVVDDDDDAEGGEEVDTSFIPKMELPPWVEVENEENDNDDDDVGVEGREEVDTSFVGKKDLPPWGEVEDFGQRDSRTVDTTSASKEMGLRNERGAIFLEEMDENVLSNRISVLSRTNKIRSAMEYFRSMELSGLCPDIHACNSLISSLIRNGRFDDCFKVFNFTRTRKITTARTYSLILMAHVKSQGCDSAIEFFRELESECAVEKDFDAVVYNTMISICRKVDNWSEMERVWRGMKANGCAGTYFTYRLLVNSFARCGQSELVLCSYHEMIQNGFEPDRNTLSAIISVYAKEGKLGAASCVFHKMLKGGLKPNTIACNSLINSLGRAGELKLAFHVYETMKSLGHKPDAYTFNALLSSLNKANRHHKALQLFEMIERNEASQLNIHLYNTVLKSCSKLRLWDRAIEILWQMESSGLSDLTVSYNLVIRTCERARKPTIALQVYEHMVHRKCTPNMLTYLSIIRCCVRGDLWEKLEEILQTMPNAALYNAAVQGMCIRRKVNLAKKVYAKMLESSLQPDVKTEVLMHSMIMK